MGVRRKLAGTVIGSALPLQLIGAIWPGVRKARLPLGRAALDFRKQPPDAQYSRAARSQILKKTYRIYGKTLG